MKIKSILWDIFILCLTLIIIFFQFNQIPGDLTYDEVDFIRLAQSLDHKPYTPYSPLATGHSTSYFYILLASFKLFGVNIFALRVPSAVFGLLSVIVFSFVMKIIFPPKKYYLKIFNTNMPFYFLASVMLISQRWFFHFARFSFEATFLIFLELISIYFFIKILQPTRTKKLFGFLIISGLFAGLAYNSYLPGRIFFLLPLSLLGYLVIRKRFHWKTIAAFLLPFIIVILPLNIYLLQHPDIRVAQLSYVQNTELSIQTKVQFFIENCMKLPMMLFMPGKGDHWGVHNYPLKPALNPIMNLLFFGGMFYGFLKKKNIITGLFFIWIIISSIPTLFTYPWENPNMLRTITMIPSIIYFSILSLIAMNELKQNKSIKLLIPIMIILLVILSAAYELRTYYRYQAEVIEDSFNLREDIYGTEDKKIQKLYFEIMRGNFR